MIVIQSLRTPGLLLSGSLATFQLGQEVRSVHCCSSTDPLQMKRPSSICHHNRRHDTLTSPAGLAGGPALGDRMVCLGSTETSSGAERRVFPGQRRRLTLCSQFEERLALGRWGEGIHWGSCSHWLKWMDSLHLFSSPLSNYEWGTGTKTEIRWVRACHTADALSNANPEGTHWAKSVSGATILAQLVSLAPCDQ